MALDPSFDPSFSLVQTAQANGREPWAYLKQVFTELPQATTVAQIEALLPWRTAPTRLAAGLPYGD